MDVLGELEAMANTATFDTEVTASDVERWQRLFGFTVDEARRDLESYRGDLSRGLVSDELWCLVKEVKEPYGFDIEAYSYSLKVKQSPQGPKKRAVRNSATYILKLEGQSELWRMSKQSLGWPISLRISSSARDRVLEWLALNHPTYTPTIVRLSSSSKELSSYSLAPSLGMETTLPHQRTDTIDFEPLPRQNEYSVWYFFCGWLLEPELLQRQLSLTKEPIYRPAKIQGAKMRSWQGKYKAVVDGSEDDVVEGGAFLMGNREWEENLRFFETDMYEVVRCRIQMNDREREEVSGLVFRFCGLGSDLI